MKIIIEVKEQRSIDSIVEFSEHCHDTTDGNADYLDVIKRDFVKITGCNADDVKIFEDEK